MAEPQKCTHSLMNCELCAWENGYDDRYLAAHRIGRFAPRRTKPSLLERIINAASKGECDG